MQRHDGCNFQLFDVASPFENNADSYGPANYGLDRSTKRVLRQYLAHGGVLGSRENGSPLSSSAAETARLQSQLGARAAAKLSDPRTDAALEEYRRYAAEAAAALKWHSKRRDQGSGSATPAMGSIDEVSSWHLQQARGENAFLSNSTSRRRPFTILTRLPDAHLSIFPNSNMAANPRPIFTSARLSHTGE